MATTLLLTLFTLALTTALLTLLRLYHILHPSRPKPLRRLRRDPENPTHLLIILGSGGHTAEMLSMLSRAVHDSDLDLRDYTHRTWVVGSGDKLSATRAQEFEEMAIARAIDAEASEAKLEGIGNGSSVIVSVPRARAIHQSLFTTPLSCLRCLGACLIVLLKHRDIGRGFPDLVLCNGPATGTVMVVACWVLRFWDWGGCQALGKMRVVYVESWARVRRVSLSGWLLGWGVERFVVQWPGLAQEKGRGRGRAEYLGVLV